MCCGGVPSDDEQPQRPLHELSAEARAHFFIRIVKQNRKIFRTLMAADTRLRNSHRTATLYRHTDPLSDIVARKPDDSAQPVGNDASVKVVPTDSLDTAYKLQQRGLKDVLVLNMANADYPGGSYLSGAGAQEEALCRRTSLYVTLSGNPTFYPIPPHGAIYSPDVLVIRKSDDEWCARLPEDKMWWTSVVSVAALFRPPIDETGTRFARREDKEEMRERIKTVLRVAAREGKRNLVLSALGCGAFRNPPEAVAKLFKAVLTDAEFQGRFKGVWFSILDRKGSNNCEIFHRVLNGLRLR
jgi:uncharacterized protein (TIGR02452 family)